MYVFRFIELSAHLRFFGNWKKEKSNDPKNLMSTQCMDDIISMLSGIIQCLSKHFQLVKPIPINPGRLNSDLVENMFCQQRTICNGANTNPTIQQYGHAVNSIVHGQAPISRKRNAVGTTMPFNIKSSKL